MQQKKTIYMGYSVQSVITSILLFLSALVCALFFEYRFFCTEIYRVLALQTQYRMYMHDLQKKNGDQQAHACDDQVDIVRQRTDKWGVRGEDFIVVNRDPEYLKNSMIDYFKKSQLGEVLTHVNMHDWQEYVGYENNTVVAPITVRQGKRVFRAVKQKSVNLDIVKRKRYGIDMPHALVFSWPLDTDQFWISSLFGPRKKANGTWGRHTGIDMAANRGTPVKAVADGTVFESRYVSGYGNTVVLFHGNRYKTRFAHLDQIFVKCGEYVTRGAIIGTVGSTGFIRKKGKDGSHLHFEVCCHNNHIDPLTVLPVLT